MCFPQTMLLEEVVKHAHYCVGPLPSVIRLLVDLPRDGFTTYPKDSTLPWGQEGGCQRGSEPAGPRQRSSGVQVTRFRSGRRTECTILLEDLLGSMTTPLWPNRCSSVPIRAKIMM